MASSTERRWIILDSTGQHITVGRHTDPSDAELHGAAVALRGMDLGGWLCVLEGTYYGPGTVRVRQVSELADTSVPFAEALALFTARRQQGAAYQPNCARPMSV